MCNMSFTKKYEAKRQEAKYKLDRKLMPSKIEGDVIKLAKTDDRMVMVCGRQGYLGKNPEYKQVRDGMTTRWMKVAKGKPWVRIPEGVKVERE